MRMMKYFAPLFALICIRFPAGVIVYYATSNICRIIQQDAMYRFDPKVKALVAAEVEEVEELTQEIDERERNRPGYTPPRGAKAAPSDSTPAKPAKADAPTGRSRFRDLLAQAAEQQKAQQDAKEAAKKADGGGGGGAKGGAGTKSGSSPGKAPSGNGNGSGSGSKGSTSAKGGGAKGSSTNGRNGPSGQGSSQSGQSGQSGQTGQSANPGQAGAVHRGPRARGACARSRRGGSTKKVHKRCGRNPAPPRN